MRKVLTKENLVTPKSVRFLYDNKLGNIVLYFCTRRWVSKIVGRYLDSKLSCHKIKKYVKKNNINMNDFIEEKYTSFNDFFTRKIKKELRPVSDKYNELVSPSDGKVSAYRIDDNSLFNIKGFYYTVESLLKNSELAKKYNGGYCVVIRLSVDDYHRYIYVDDCEKDSNVFIKGKLHTVQPYALGKRRVFSENCREYTVMHTKNFGDITQVEVGAMMVGRIVNNHDLGKHYKGEEKGKFEFGGSTIVLLIEKDKVIIDEEFLLNTNNDCETIVKCGECIGKAV